jgi:hypothetical protein
MVAELIVVVEQVKVEEKKKALSMRIWIDTNEFDCESKVYFTTDLNESLLFAIECIDCSV